MWARTFPELLGAPVPEEVTSHPLPCLDGSVAVSHQRPKPLRCFLTSLSKPLSELEAGSKMVDYGYGHGRSHRRPGGQPYVP